MRKNQTDQETVSETLTKVSAGKKEKELRKKNCRFFHSERAISFKRSN